jgi:hypothetical protein
LAGLTPTPYQSGDGNREQGIDKAGNCHIRAIAIEIAWGWLRHQPDSALSQWYQDRFGHGNSRRVCNPYLRLGHQGQRIIIPAWMGITRNRHRFD